MGAPAAWAKEDNIIQGDLGHYTGPTNFIDRPATWATQERRDRSPFWYHIKYHIPTQKLKLISGGPNNAQVVLDVGASHNWWVGKKKQYPRFITHLTNYQCSILLLPLVESHANIYRWEWRGDYRLQKAHTCHRDRTRLGVQTILHGISFSLRPISLAAVSRMDLVRISNQTSLWNNHKFHHLHFLPSHLKKATKWDYYWKTVIKNFIKHQLAILV